MKLALGWTFRPMPRGEIHVHRELPLGRAGVQGGRKVVWEPGNF